MKNEDEIALKCPKCEYKWLTRSKLDWVTCPNCQRRFDKNESLLKKNSEIEKTDENNQKLICEDTKSKTTKEPKYLMKRD